MNLERALKTDGFMSETELAYLAHVAQKSRRILEVGSWKGRSTIALAENTSGIVWAVDTWQGRLEHDVRIGLDRQFFIDFQNNTKGLDNIWPVPLKSSRAFALMLACGMKFDMIFIDATHHYDYVSRDIQMWRELLTHDGILCGHDYGDVNWPGVKQAVDELVPSFRIIGTIWTTEPEIDPAEAAYEFGSAVGSILFKKSPIQIAMEKNK